MLPMDSLKISDEAVDAAATHLGCDLSDARELLIVAAPFLIAPEVEEAIARERQRMMVAIGRAEPIIRAQERERLVARISPLLPRWLYEEPIRAGTVEELGAAQRAVNKCAAELRAVIEADAAAPIISKHAAQTALDGAEPIIRQQERDEIVARLCSRRVAADEVVGVCDGQFGVVTHEFVAIWNRAIDDAVLTVREASNGQ